MLGLFRVKNDNQFAAVFLEQDITILFPGSDGVPYRDQARYGKLDEISEDALYSKVGDEILLEAVSAIKENRPARWTQRNF